MITALDARLVDYPQSRAGIGFLTRKVCESRAAEYQDAVTPLDLLCRREALLKVHRVVEKARRRGKYVTVDGAATPTCLRQRVFLVSFDGAPRPA